MHLEGLLRILKVFTRRLRFREAIVYAEAIHYTDSRSDMDEWEFSQFPDSLARLVYVNLQFCVCFASTALGLIDNGMRSLNEAADNILNRGYLVPVIINMNLTELTEELKQAVDNELIRVKFLWRCCYQLPLPATEQSGPEWQVGIVKQSFWEWTEYLEELEAALP
jgi:hypothetical protein